MPTKLTQLKKFKLLNKSVNNKINIKYPNSNVNQNETYLFNSELAKLLEENSDDESNEDRCLISNEPLIEDQTYIMSCNHKFNYGPLFNEIKKQKNNLTYSLETQKLKKNEIKCPYCRTIQPGLLYKHPDYPYVKYVNFPKKSVYVSKHKCMYTFIKGKRMNEECGKPTTYYNTKYCEKHYKMMKKKDELLLKSSKNNEDKTKNDIVQSFIDTMEKCKKKYKLSSSNIMEILSSTLNKWSLKQKKEIKNIVKSSTNITTVDENTDTNTDTNAFNMGNNMDTFLICKKQSSFTFHKENSQCTSKCSYVFKRGKNKNKCCGAAVMDIDIFNNKIPKIYNKYYCKKHSKQPKEVLTNPSFIPFVSGMDYTDFIDNNKYVFIQNEGFFKVL